jgi:hypothetical protein
VFTDGSVAGTGGGKPGDVACGSWLDPVVSGLAALAPTDGDEERSAPDCGSAGDEVRAGATGAGTSIGKSVARTAGNTIGVSVVAEFFALRESIAVALLAGFCEPLKLGVGTGGVVSFAGGEESWEAHMAAKLPEFRIAGLLRPEKPEAAAGAGAALLVIASSMAEVTVGSKDNAKAHRHGCISCTKRRKRGEEAEGERKGSGIKRIQISPMEEGERQECRCWARAAQTRQNLTTPQVGLPQKEEVVE